MQVSAYDVAIIGAGIHGCSAAYHLARRGARVALLEADYAGRHASGVNAGGVRVLGRRLPEIPLTLASSAMWHELSESLGHDAGFFTGGQIKVAESDADLDILRERVQLMHQHGYTHEVLIDADATREILPAVAGYVRGAIWVESDGFAIPYHAVTAFRLAALKLGVKLYEQCRVSQAEHRSGRWVLNTPQGQVAAKTLVVAAGAWTGRLAAAIGDPIPVTPGGLMLMVTQRLPAFVTPVVGATSRGLSFKQFDNGTVVIGGELHCDSDLDAAHAELNFARLANSARIVTDLFPFLKNVAINRTWSGMDGFTPDSVPIVGYSNVAPDLVYSCGFSASGFQLGPACGQAVSELVLDGASSIPIDGLSPSRFLDSSLQNKAA